MSAVKRPPWPDNRHPTSTEWVDWFLSHDREGQEQIAAKAIGHMADINRCLSSGAGTCWINR